MKPPFVVCTDHSAAKIRHIPIIPRGWQPELRFYTINPKSSVFFLGGRHIFKMSYFCETL